MSAAAFIPTPVANGLPTLHLFISTIAAKTTGGVENHCILKIFGATHVVPRRPGEPAPEWSDPISPEEFAECANATERGVAFALAHALKAKLIERRKAGRLYAYRVCPENWESSPNYEPEREPKKGEEKTNARGSGLPSRAPLILKPGSRSRPFNLSQITENATDIQYEVDKDLPALSIQSTVEAGNLVLSIKNAPGTLPDTPASPPAAEELEKIRKMLNGMFRAKMGPVETGLCRQVLQIRGHATIEDITARLWMRTKDKQLVTPKLILMIVQDCANAASEVEQAEAKMRAQIEAERKFQTDQAATELAEAYRNGSEEHRAWMREVLEYTPSLPELEFEP